MDTSTRETLLILMEECSEVTQAVSKCFRFGLNNVKPGDGRTNLEHLQEECGDLLCMIDLLVESGVLQRDALDRAKSAKLQKLARWSTITPAK